ncbi:hypothetical protein Btru_029761 [Bulinus truncatus]|nr:hypothetical protein Btru_029761 [Bulinus truncatus]
MSTSTSCDKEDREWHTFLASSLVTFAGGVVLIGAYRIFVHVCCSKKFRFCAGDQTNAHSTHEQKFVLKNLHPEIGWLTEAKDWAGGLISGQTSTGRILFVAASDKLWFWIELFSFVDYFTIPPSFVAIYLDRNWLGLRFLRALRLMSIPDILTYLNIIKTSTLIRFVQLVVSFVSLWLTAAGFLHLLENSGDPFFKFNNPHKLTYWECLYFLLVTMSTVGFGDICAETVLGRAFVVIFIMIFIGLFASFVPEIADIVGKRQRFAGSYKKERGKRGLPGLEFEGLLKRHFTQVDYFWGSVMNAIDLERVKVLDGVPFASPPMNCLVVRRALGTHTEKCSGAAHLIVNYSRLDNSAKNIILRSAEMCYLLVVLVLLSTVSFQVVKSHGDGTNVDAACQTLLPGHGPPSQNSLPPYKISFSPPRYIPGEPISITLLSCKDAFKGFMIQAHSAETSRNQDERFGNFTASENKLACNGSALVHSNNSPKTTVNIAWNPPEAPKGHIIFRFASLLDRKGVGGVSGRHGASAPRIVVSDVRSGSGNCDSPYPSGGDSCFGLKIQTTACDGSPVYPVTSSSFHLSKVLKYNLTAYKDQRNSKDFRLVSLQNVENIKCKSSVKEFNALSGNLSCSTPLVNQTLANTKTINIISRRRIIPNLTTTKTLEGFMSDFRALFAYEEKLLGLNSAFIEFPKLRRTREVKVEQDDPFLFELNPGLENTYTIWTIWSACSASCGGGTRKRTRSCKDKTVVCRGEIKPTQYCNIDPCPVQGGWGAWQSWTLCSTTCGPGFTERYRPCDNPLPAFGGSCAGTNKESRDCNLGRCNPFLITWSVWSLWSACSKTCGGGYRKRSSFSSLPSFLFLQKPKDESAFCNFQPCPVNGLWAAWAGWTKCSEPCGIGNKVRDRTCTDPAPNYGGNPCDGEGSDLQTCFAGPCLDEDDFGIKLEGNGYLRYPDKGKTTGFFMVFLRLKPVALMGTIFHQVRGCGKKLTNCDCSVMLVMKNGFLELEVKNKWEKQTLKLFHIQALSG